VQPQLNRRGFGYDYDSPTGIPDEDHYNQNSPVKKRQKVGEEAKVVIPELPIAGPSNLGARQGTVPEGGPTSAVRSHNGPVSVTGGK
jgi:hypothetical protein